MKKILTFLTVIAAALLLTPNQAEARSSRGHSHGSQVYVSGHSSCGCPIYTRKTFCHHDRYGRAVYTYHTQPVTHRCNHYNHHRGRHHNHGNRHHGHRHHGHHGNRHHSGHRNHRSSGFSITYRR